jgi:hypothetical protein
MNLNHFLVRLVLDKNFGRFRLNISFVKQDTKQKSGIFWLEFTHSFKLAIPDERE